MLYMYIYIYIYIYICIYISCVFLIYLPPSELEWFLDGGDVVSDVWAHRSEAWSTKGISDQDSSLDHCAKLSFGFDCLYCKKWTEFSFNVCMVTVAHIFVIFPTPFVLHTKLSLVKLFKRKRIFTPKSSDWGRSCLIMSHMQICVGYKTNV